MDETLAGLVLRGGGATDPTPENKAPQVDVAQDL